MSEVVPSDSVAIVDTGSPIILSLPHAGTSLPRELASGLRIAPADLWSDWNTSELFAPLTGVGVSLVSTGLSRFVADVNRGPGKCRSGPFWSSRVPTSTPSGEELYFTEPSQQNIDIRLARAWGPYHSALARVVERALGLHSRVVLLDLHSFGMDLPADVIVGDRNGASASEECVVQVEALLQGEGLMVQRNLRFIGGWVVQQFEPEQRVDAIQLEFNQRLYLNNEDVRLQNPRPRLDPEGFEGLQRRVQRVVASMLGN